MRCLVCKSVWNDADPHDPFFACDYCKATRPVEVAAEYDKLYAKAKEIWFDLKYKGISTDGHRITSTGGIAWTWVIAYQDDNTLEPMYRPIEFGEERDELNDKKWEIYDCTGFLVTPSNVGKYNLTVEEAEQLIHWGKIQFVYQWLKPRRKHRKYHFPKDKSLVTSFLGETSGYGLISALLARNTIVWNDEYQVYTTYHFNPSKPPELRYRPNSEE
jgi:hypothetical protein